MTPTSIQPQKNVLSVFDGMSCFQQALQQQGITYDNYYASEIDKYAIKVTQANYPNTIQLGSIVDINPDDLPIIDFFAGGSPCQSFSFAGKRAGMATKDKIEIFTLEHYLQLKADGYIFEGQSYLFWEYMRLLTALRKKNPEIKFLLENVMMGEKWEKILTRAIGVNPIEINSALVSAQNRRRLYWTNIGMEPAGFFGDPVSIIKQPKDKGILLKQILETEVDEKYYLSDKMLAYFRNRAANFNNGKVNIRDEQGKVTTLTSSMASCDISDNFVKIVADITTSDISGKAKCFTSGGNSGGLHSDMDLIADPIKLNNEDSFCIDSDGNVSEDKTGTLTASYSKGAENHGCRPFIMTGATKKSKSGVTQLNPSTESGGKQPYMQNRVFDIEEKNPALTTLWNGGNLINTSKIRRLTPTECERLQTVKDGYTAHVSDTQRYRMLGNGWTIKVITHILSYL